MLRREEEGSTACLAKGGPPQRARLCVSPSACPHCPRPSTQRHTRTLLGHTEDPHRAFMLRTVPGAAWEAWQRCWRRGLHGAAMRRLRPGPVVRWDEMQGDGRDRKKERKDDSRSLASPACCGRPAIHRKSIVFAWRKTLFPLQRPRPFPPPRGTRRALRTHRTAPHRPTNQPTPLV